MLDLSAYEVIPKPWNIEPSVPEIKLWFGFAKAKWNAGKVDSIPLSDLDSN